MIYDTRTGEPATANSPRLYNPILFTTTTAIAENTPRKKTMTSTGTAPTSIPNPVYKAAYKTCCLSIMLIIAPNANIRFPSLDIYDCSSLWQPPSKWLFHLIDHPFQFFYFVVLFFDFLPCLHQLLPEILAVLL